VRGVRMEALDFPGASYAEAFLGAGMRFHLWHKKIF
jgi:hypothetical protein